MIPAELYTRYLFKRNTSLGRSTGDSFISFGGVSFSDHGCRSIVSFMQKRHHAVCCPASADTSGCCRRIRRSDVSLSEKLDYRTASQRPIIRPGRIHFPPFLTPDHRVVVHQLFFVAHVSLVPFVFPPASFRSVVEHMEPGQSLDSIVPLVRIFPSAILLVQTQCFNRSLLIVIFL